MTEFWKRFLSRITDLRGWRDADKCILASSLTIPFVAVWILRLTMAKRNPTFGPYLDQAFLGPMLAFVWFQAAGHISIILSGLALRRRSSRNAWFVHLTIQFWFACYFLDIYAIGPYTSPFAMLILVFPVLGFLVFTIRQVYTGLATFAVLLVMSTFADRLGLIPYAPLMATPPFFEGRPYTSWILSVGALPMVASALILVIFAHIIVQWRAREQELRELSKTDYLTGVRNRRSFMEHAEREFARAERHGNELAIVMVDVDHFKRVNDTYGHAIGDEVIKLVAKILVDEMRTYDVVARYGGEEFSILLSETTQEQARIMAERCRQRIERTGLVVNRTSVKVTASLGIASHSSKNLTGVEQLLDLADKALYEAKSGGRNRVAIAA